MRLGCWVLSALGTGSILLASGCGRLGFESTPRRDDAAVAVAIAPDAAIDAAIPAPDAPPDAITLADIGCADGSREGFADLAAFPTIAGCAATWSGTPSLRTTATGAPCGNEIGACAAPADACGPGWHMCGDSGDPTELTARISGAQCETAGGSTQSFVAATSHCDAANDETCGYTAPYDCLTNQWCAEPVCCGAGCRDTQACRDGVFPGDTLVGGDVSQGCGALPSTDGVGVLCCR